MPRVRLTKIFVLDAMCPATRAKIDFFDLGQPGFMLEVRSSGGKTYYQRYSDEHGRTRQFKIGPFDILGLSAARRKGKSVMAEALLGTDPSDRRRELRSIPRLEDFVLSRFIPHIRVHKRSWKTDETILRIHVLPVLGRLFLDEVTGEAVSAIVQQMREEGYSAGTTNRVVIVVRHLFNTARRWRVPGAAENPTIGIRLAADTHRERFLSEDEAFRLLASLREDENQAASRAILLLLLTGARRNEITHAKWVNVDWERKVLLVPRSKSGKPRAIALNEAAIKILIDAPRIEGNEYIFPSSTTGRPPPSLHFPWTRIRNRAGLQDVRLHDLRHSFASFLVNEGVSLYVVQALLGHSHSRYTQRYAHLTSETVHEATETIGRILRLKA